MAKSLIETIADNNYVATASQVGQLAKELVSAIQAITGVNATYLRVLIAGVQTELGASPRLRAAKAGAFGKLTDDQKATQMAALEAVNAKYYEAILEAVIDDECRDNSRLHKDERSRRSLERNRRTNFARSAKSTLASYIRAGFDVLGIVVISATKRGIYDAVLATRQAVQPTADSLSKDVSNYAAKLETVAAALCEKDANTARQEIERVLGVLTSLLMSTGAKGTDKPADAFNRCVPLVTKVGMFWPAAPAPETRQ